MTRRLTRTFHLAFAFAGAGMLAACVEDDERPPIVWEGAYLRFGTDQDMSYVCAGTLPYMDEIIPHLAGIFGEPTPTVDYYWSPRAADDVCGAGVAGCSVDWTHEVFSGLVFSQHELVHAVRPSAYSHLEEGIAEIYGSDSDIEKDAEPASIPEVYQREGPTDYPTVGHFASYLRAFHGAEAFLDLAAASDYRDSFERTKERFFDAFDASFEDIAVEYAASYPVCARTFYRDDSFECGRNVVEAPGQEDEELRMEVSLECDEPNVIGPRLGDRWTTVTLDVALKARYGLQVVPTEPDGGVAFDLVRPHQVRVRRCDSSCFDEAQPVNTDPVLLSGFDGYGATMDEYCLEPGRYTFRISLQEDESATFRFAVWPARVTDDCG